MNVYVASNLDKHTPQTKKCPLDLILVLSSVSFFASPTDGNEVKNVISQLKTGKSVGPYSIPINLLKMLNSVIVSPLVVPINESFSTEIFPDKLEIADVVALHKKAPLAILPITDLLHFCLSSVKYLKTLCIRDCIIFLKLTKFFTLYKFWLSQKTFHFTYFDKYEHIKNTIENGNYIYGCGIFIDPKKDFDTVNHTILLKKLEEFTRSEGSHSNGSSLTFQLGNNLYQ